MKLAFLGLRASWVDSNFEFQSTTVGFVPLTESHSGFNVCVALVLKLMDLGLLSKLQSVTLDNASSNDTLVSFLHQIIDLWRSQLERSHLVPGVIVNELARNVDPAVISIMRTLAETLSMNHSTESDASLTSITSTAVPDDIRKLIKKAQAVARMLANSPALRDKLEKQCVAMNVSFRLLIQAVKTRWNSVHEMIDPLIHLWRPLNAVMLQVQPQQYAKYCSAFRGDSSMAFGDSDLHHFKALKVFLQPFYDATKQLSAGDTPTAHLVIPQFTSLCNQMKGIIDDVNPMWLRNGAQCALAKLEKYSDAICKCDGYIVATVLDP
ncbi:ribonuclease H-like domain-containing protein [Obelidium mucronatum]|nr:ribonuclease H-like domain-containing protein [Obelidium mucronatum]